MDYFSSGLNPSTIVVSGVSTTNEFAANFKEQQEPRVVQLSKKEQKEGNEDYFDNVMEKSEVAGNTTSSLLQKSVVSAFPAFTMT